MNLNKLIVRISYQALGIAVMSIGLGMVVIAFINSPFHIKIASGLIGLGFITLGLVQVKRLQDEKRDKGRFDEIIAKLDEIQQELKKEDKPKGTGVVIADVISSGLKYYTEHMTKQPKEEDKE
ncbi:MAG: hypothetical protein ABID87_07030 [Chloroflexota bacterium]